MRKLLMPAACLLCSVQANAITTTVASFSTLPSDIRNCFETGYCLGDTLGTNLYADSYIDGVSAFQYVQLNGSTYDFKWLMRYDLLTPPGTVAGAAWISAQNSYNIAGSDAHNFTLYFNDMNNGYLTAPPITVTVNDNDLADGSAFRSQYFGLVEYEPGYFTYDLIASGALGIDLPFCLADGCGSSAQFNLLHMYYADGLFNFNPQDTRGLLFNRNNWYNCGYEDCGGYAQSQNLYVHAVPLPASALLLISGLVGGTLSTRRQYSKPKE
ncbi:MAG: hypothetical protein HY941_03450 [Gammaproteobacteria bacterium]|nr:hypothetical protein [Gammaproteobacteria bacterium]